MIQTHFGLPLLVVTNTDNSLPKTARLRSKIVMDEMFAHRQSFNAFPFRLLYHFHEYPTAGKIQVAFSVPKRFLKHANNRNLCKRRMREVWRRHFRNLETLPELEQKNLAIVLMLNSREIPGYKLAEDKIMLLLNRLKQAGQGNLNNS